MASDNPYHITTPYEVESRLAGYASNVQQAELGKLQLDEVKRKLAEEAMARNIKAQAVQGLEKSQQQAVPAGFDGEVPGTSFGGEKTMVPAGAMFLSGGATSPNGSPMPSFMGGAQAEEAAKQPVVQPQTTPVQQYKESQSEYASIGNQIKEAAAISKGLKDKGLVDQAEEYDAKILKLQSSASKAKEDFLNHSTKVLGIAGQLTNGYLDFVKAHPNDPAAQDAAWQRMAMQAKMLGADDQNKLVQMPPEQRMQWAEQMTDQAKTGAERAREALEKLKAVNQAERTSKLVSLGRDRMALTERLAGASRELQKDKLNFAEGRFEYNAYHKNIEQEIKNATDQKASIDKDLGSLEKSLRDFQAGNMFFTADGKPITSDDPELRAKEGLLLSDAIEAKHQEKQQLDDYIAKVNVERENLEKQIPGKKKVSLDHSNTFRSTLDTSKYNYTSTADPESRKKYAEVMAHAKSLLKTDPKEAERIQGEAQKRMLEAGMITKAR